MRGSVLFNEDEVKHAGLKQQQQSKKHTQRKLGWPDRAKKLLIRSPVQHTQRSVLSARTELPTEMQLPVARSKFAVCILKLFCS